MNGYELSRIWFDWCFENPEKITPNHSALYFFAIEHCNRLGWRNKFGFPTEMAKDAIGIKSYKTYINTLNDLVEWGFIKMIERSKNQYSANIVALVNFDKATTKALDKALDKAITKHISKQVQSTYQSIDSINKPLTIEQLTIEQSQFPFNFLNSLIDLGVEKELAKDWLKVRKTKKLTNTQTAFNNLKIEFDKSGKEINEIINKCVTNSWGGFKSSWNWDDNINQKNKTDARITEIATLARLGLLTPDDTGGFDCGL